MTEQRNRIASIDISRGTDDVFHAVGELFLESERCSALVAACGPRRRYAGFFGYDLSGVSLYHGSFRAAGGRQPPRQRRFDGEDRVACLHENLCPGGHGAIDGQFRRRLFGRRNGPFPRKLCDAHGFGVLPGLERLPADRERLEKAWHPAAAILGSGAAGLAGGCLPGQRRFGIRHSVVGHPGTDRMDLSVLYAGVSGGRQTSGGACRCHTSACGGSFVAGVWDWSPGTSCPTS